MTSQKSQPECMVWTRLFIAQLAQTKIVIRITDTVNAFTSFSLKNLAISCFYNVVQLLSTPEVWLCCTKLRHRRIAICMTVGNCTANLKSDVLNFYLLHNVSSSRSVAVPVPVYDITQPAPSVYAGRCTAVVKCAAHLLYICASKRELVNYVAVHTVYLLSGIWRAAHVMCAPIMC